MRSHIFSAAGILSLLVAGCLFKGTSASQILETSGFSTCLDESNITVSRVNIQYDAGKQQVTFDVAGSSKTTMNVTAVLNVTAYGNNVYTNNFNPCDKATFVAQLCPVPKGSFSATGVQAIPDAYASIIPAIAFQIPDIAAKATLQLKALDGGHQVACLTSQVTNGKTVAVPAVSYVAVAIGGAALLMAGASTILGALAAGAGTPGGGVMSPSFSEVVAVFQGFAMNGMMSVNYPPVYRSFAKNFGFSAGIVAWTPMQMSIDSFRSKTGGNLTNDNVQFLQNATLVFTDGSANSNSVVRRLPTLLAREITTTVNTTAPDNSTSGYAQIQSTVAGISAYVEQLSVPQANTFMTVLLIVAIIVGAIVVGVLLFKLILEAWAVFGSFPKKLGGFRKHYWGTMARSIVQLILILYGIWVLYCIYEFRHGDSWAAKVLAGVTLAIFTGILAYFTFQIFRIARRAKADDGDVSLLYEDKETWTQYSLFYDAYKKSYWWAFIPAIVYMFAKGAVLAATDGHGLVQTAAQLAIEGLMLGLLLFARPFERRSGNIINIFIQVVRVLSVVCVLVFVEELGITQTTQTITGVVLIAIQAALTVTLAILLAVNGIIICCKANPHRQRRKEAEKLNRDVDDLTPLDARNSLLIRSSPNSSPDRKATRSPPIYTNVPAPPSPPRLNPLASEASKTSLSGASHRRLESREALMGGAAPFEGGNNPGYVPRPGYAPRSAPVAGYGGIRGNPAFAPRGGGPDYGYAPLKEPTVPDVMGDGGAGGAGYGNAGYRGVGARSR